MFAQLIGQGLALAPNLLEVQKYKADGTLKMHYWGRLLGANQDERLIQAIGDFEQQIQGDFWLCNGDEYIEWYSQQKGYNILEIHARPSGKLKFWYCNICHPARFKDDKIIWTDLALDLLVSPQGHFFLLDQDELAVLNLDWQSYKEAWKNLMDLLVFINTKVKF